MKKRLLTALMTATISVLCVTPALAADLVSGSYSLKQGNKSVNVYVNKINSAKNYTAINMYSSDDTNTQDFIFEEQKDGNFKISISKPGYTMNVTAIKADTDVIVYQDKKANTEYYTIKEEKDGKYSICLKKNQTLALTATGGKGLTFKKYTGEANQQFYLESNDNNSGVVDNENTIETIKLNVPRISTQDKRWKNFEYDAGAKIGVYGCLLCSVTAALSEVDETTYRPDELAANFNFSDGYMSWESGYAKRFKNAEYSLETIVSELKEGDPVLVHGYSAKYKDHWAVITGVNGDGTQTDHFTIMDPSYKSTATLTEFLNMFPSKKRLAVVK